jgi:hypothetical protein
MFAALSRLPCTCVILDLCTAKAVGEERGGANGYGF